MEASTGIDGDVPNAWSTRQKTGKNSGAILEKTAIRRFNFSGMQTDFQSSGKCPGYVQHPQSRILTMSVQAAFWTLGEQNRTPGDARRTGKFV